MTLTKKERKKKLGRGGQRRIAHALSVSESTVSAIMADRTQLYAPETVAAIRAAVAQDIGLPIEEVFRLSVVELRSIIKNAKEEPNGGRK